MNRFKILNLVTFITFPYKLFITHRKIEDEDVGGVPHGLVQEDNQDNKKVSYEADHNDEGEEDGHDDRDNGHQGLQLFHVHLLLLINIERAIHLNNCQF